MKRPMMLVFAGLMIGLLTATGALLASNNQGWTPPPPFASTTTIEPAARDSAGVYTVRTGQMFSDLHLQGVIPCSPMLVKGGGHLILLTRKDRPYDSCSYHVKSTKQISLDGKTFEVTVVDDDTIRAAPATPALAARYSNR